MHLRDLSLIQQVQTFFGGIGSIHIIKSLNKVNYSVDSIKDLIKLIAHFEKYTLLTQKAADFTLFKEVITLMMNKSHLTIEGLNKINKY
jgi:hypothetical protein